MARYLPPVGFEEAVDEGLAQDNRVGRAVGLVVIGVLNLNSVKQITHAGQVARQIRGDRQTVRVFGRQVSGRLKRGRKTRFRAPSRNCKV
jgi:hypothetical protein